MQRLSNYELGQSTTLLCSSYPVRDRLVAPVRRGEDVKTITRGIAVSCGFCAACVASFAYIAMVVFNSMDALLPRVNTYELPWLAPGSGFL